MRSAMLALVTLALLVAGCHGGGSHGATLTPTPSSGATQPTLRVAADRVVGQLQPLWSDHYDLSYTLHGYAADSALQTVLRDVRPRSWRTSVGRWEIGSVVAGGDSLDPSVARGVEREFYRGSNDLAAADDPANFDFTYLDRHLGELVAAGVEPFLCFDYMPFTLSSQQDPRNAQNLGLVAPDLSFSNGIRTAPPADPLVHARVVRNVIRHVRGLFGGTRDFGVEYVEVGNEPDLVDANGQPLPLFWTGTRAQLVESYAAIAAEVDGDADLRARVRLGAASFAMQAGEPTPRFVESFLDEVSRRGLRLDFVSYHSYGDAPGDHRRPLVTLEAALRTTGLSPEVVNAEWGRLLDGAVDPVYSTIEHGLLRARALFLMQTFDVSIAHASPFGDPIPGTDLLGLVRTGPGAHKPVSWTYAALSALNGLTEALEVPTSGSVLAGRDPAGTRVGVALAASGGETCVLALERLPWTTSTRLVRWEATDAGLRREERVVQGAVIDSVTAPATGAVVVWVATRA